MSQILRYEKGQVPFRPVGIQIVDEDSGENLNLTTYDEITAELVDSNHKKVDTTGLLLSTGFKAEGKVFVYWPVGRSLFTRTGKYYLRLNFAGFGKNDYSDTVEIRVTEFGRMK